MATVSMPSSRQARITRSAISPRLATRILLYIGSVPFWRGSRPLTAAVDLEQRPDLLPRVDLEQRLAELDRLTVGDQHGHDLARDLCRNLVKDLHGFDQADGRGGADV